MGRLHPLRELLFALFEPFRGYVLLSARGYAHQSSSWPATEIRMNRPTVLPLGRTAWAWIKQGGKPTRTSSALRLSYAWQSFWFDRNLALQQRLPPASPLKTDPVFILGLWRSGTTYLHDLLSACPGMLSPATWQCMGPAVFRLHSPPAGGKSVQRPMDSFTIGALSPQEDEFALLSLGVPSVYRGFFDPRRLLELTHWLNPDAWGSEQPEGWMDTWRQFLTGVTDGKLGRLVLKSPSHTFRIRALTEAFPQAAYIWIVRDPAETFFSNRKMWLAMFERYALWNWDAAVLDEFLCGAFESAAECLVRAVGLLPKERLVVADFGQLTDKTLDTLESINRRLLLGEWNNMQAPIRRNVTAKADYRLDTYDGQTLSGAAIKAAEKLLSAQQFALASHGL